MSKGQVSESTNLTLTGTKDVTTVFAPAGCAVNATAANVIITATQSLFRTLIATTPPTGAGTHLSYGFPSGSSGEFLTGTKTPVHHAATARYSRIRPPRVSRRSLSGTVSTGSTSPQLSGVRSPSPRCGRCG